MAQGRLRMAFGHGSWPMALAKLMEIYYKLEESAKCEHIRKKFGGGLHAQYSQSKQNRHCDIR